MKEGIGVSSGFIKLSWTPSADRSGTLNLTFTPTLISRLVPLVARLPRAHLPLLALWLRDLRLHRRLSGRRYIPLMKAHPANDSLYRCESYASTADSAVAGTN